MPNRPSPDSHDEYSQSPLDESQMAANPYDQLEKWLSAAVTANVPEPYAMALATATARGHPASRIVLLRDISREGLTFYTNYRSRKGLDLAENPRGAVSIFWAPLQRQIRAEGGIVKLPTALSDGYFRNRPYESRLGAWASPQSETIPGRDALESRLAEFRRQFPDDVPRPPHWGGYQLRPQRFEFWQGRPHRLNDRLQYSVTETGGWILTRLAP